MAEAPFPVIKIKGSPHDRGSQYGEKCRTMISNTIAFYKKVFEYESRLNWEMSLRKAAEFIAPIRAYDQDIMEELEGIATGSRRSLEEIVAINVRSELLFLLATRAEKEMKVCCTSVAATPNATSKGETFVAQNWDWYKATQAQCILLHIIQPGRPEILQFVEAGLIAKTGMNSAGIGMCTNALVCDNWRVGVPYHAILRGILNAESMAQAIGAVTSPQRASAGNYLIGHAQGEVLEIEAGPNDINIIYPKDGVLSHANHFQVPNPAITDYIPGRWPDSIVRGMRSANLMSTASGKIDRNRIQALLMDHFDHPSSICCHSIAGQPKEEAYQTNASIVMNLSRKKIYLAKGPSCEHHYVPIEIAI